ncbi:MAG: hypothetical protein GXO35_08580 [Gammaproteobacteria bacterium]|nr:hypothetical protein [Gammaproteobacteria bacterium]
MPVSSRLSTIRSNLNSPLSKALFFGFIWSLGFALILPAETLKAWQYSFFVGSVPSTLIWDLFNIQNPLSMVIMALFNSLILFSPYFYYLKTKEQIWWFYAAISFYGLINAVLGFTIIISLKNFGH